MNLIQLLTDQRAHEGITHSRRGVSWNWRWRRVGDEEDWRSPSPEPKWTPDLASRWRTGGDGGCISWIAIILSPWFFSGKIGFCSVDFRFCRATRWGQPTWARLEGVAHPGGLCPPRCPSLAGLGSINSYYWYKNSSQSFLPWITMFSHCLNFGGALHLCFAVSERASEIALLSYYIIIVLTVCWHLRYLIIAR